MPVSEYNPDAAFETFDRKDYEAVLKLASPHAVAGNSDAQCMVALLHQCGFGVERNVLEAERWLLKAAEQNNPVAWNNLGSLYAGSLAGARRRNATSELKSLGLIAPRHTHPRHTPSLYPKRFSIVGIVGEIYRRDRGPRTGLITNDWTARNQNDAFPSPPTCRWRNLWVSSCGQAGKL